MKTMSGIIVLHVDVMSLNSKDAEIFTERIKNTVSGKFKDWGFIVIPVRHSGSRVHVYSITNCGLEEIKPHIPEFEKLVRSCYESDEDEVSSYVKSMLGYPVFQVSKEADDIINYCVNRAFEYDANDKKEFAFEEANFYLDVYEGLIVPNKIWKQIFGE